MHAAELSECESVEGCIVECGLGYFWPVPDRVLCDEGFWVVLAQCVPQAASTIRVRTVQIDAVILPGSLDWFDASGAEETEDDLLLSIAREFGVFLDTLQVEFVDSSSQRQLDGQRHLQAHDSRVRIQLRDDTEMPDSDLVETLVCGLFTCNGSAVLLRTWNNVTMFGIGSLVDDAVSSVLSASLAQDGIGVEVILDTWEVAVVSDFTLPAAEWLEGSWDTCSTDCGKGSATRTISCPLGSSVGCAHNERPQENQPCEESVGCHPLCTMFGLVGGVCRTRTVATAAGGLALLFLACCCTSTVFCWWRRT